MKKIISTNQDGVLIVSTPTDEALSLFSIAEIEKRTAVGKVNCKVVDADKVPADKRFRGAWVLDTSNSPQEIGINSVIAKDISLARVRLNREEAFKPLDDEYRRAVRANASQEVINAIEAKRITLADATEALKALDVNNDGIISIEEANGKFLPLELIA